MSVEASVESAPGSATVTLSIPDNDINNFYADGNLLIIPMMEVELFAKGYFTVGGFPQYYRIFWGMVGAVTKSWSNGVTTINISCKDILRWWELTNVILQPAFLDASMSASGWILFQNKFAGSNPYLVITALAKEAMGDFSITAGSFTSFIPEKGPEGPVIAQYAKDIMAYWQLKFGNIWNSLVLYGSSGQAYTFAGDPGNVSPAKIFEDIIKAEDKILDLNPETAQFKTQQHEIAAFKIDFSKVGDVDFFQSEIQTKLSIAMTARDQAGGYEFYCDTTGDIIFKPPFYNLNVLPNKPVSWIQDFEIIDDSITDSEQEVFTHITSSGNAFGGVTDWGLNDDITTPRTGVIDWHLLKRYGWRRLDVQLEWAGNPRKLFYHLLDHLDKVNARRHSGTVTIPMRPELRMGFPIWFPRYDSFFYVQGISHTYSPGGQATTTLTFIARRQKFIAPKNIGSIKRSPGQKTITYDDPVTGKKSVRKSDTYVISFPSNVGNTAGLTDGQDAQFGGPAILRDPKTGKLLGFPNAVMVYRSSLSGEKLAEIIQGSGSTKAHNPQQQGKGQPLSPGYTQSQTVGSTFISLQNENRAAVIDRLRIHRYEAGMTNAGAYDYAHDEAGQFKEFAVIPTDSIEWHPDGGPNPAAVGANGLPAVGNTVEDSGKKKKIVDDEVKRLEAQLKPAKTKFDQTNKALAKARQELGQLSKEKGVPKENGEVDVAVKQKQETVNHLETEFNAASAAYSELQAQITATKAGGGRIRQLSALNVMVRPVSDEFGFEVIGHNRYGRGAFIDRGQVQIPDPNQPHTENPNSVNQLNVQFAPHGGLLTDPDAQFAPNLGASTADFATAFERMGPDDYLTGATFAGANYGKDQNLQQVNHTNQNTYSGSLRTAVSTGKAVFAEADALRRAVTLAELKPTVSAGGPRGLDSVGFERCGCELGRTDWLSVLPSSFIQQVLGPTSVAAGGDSSGVTTVLEVDGKEMILPSDGVVNPNGEVLQQGFGFFNKNGDKLGGFKAADDGSIVAGTGEVVFSPSKTVLSVGNQFSLENPGGFFDTLHKFLVQRFEQDIKENDIREKFAINGGIESTIPDLDAQDNVLGAPKNSLFNRASLGDPDALDAMAKGANFNFGKTKKSLSNFKDTVDAQEQKLNQLGSSLADIPGSIFSSAVGGLAKVDKDGHFIPTVSATTGPSPQYQPLALPAVLNPSVLPALTPGTGLSQEPFEKNVNEPVEGEGTPAPSGEVPSGI